MTTIIAKIVNWRGCLDPNYYEDYNRVTIVILGWKVSHYIFY